MNMMYEQHTIADFIPEYLPHDSLKKNQQIPIASSKYWERLLTMLWEHEMTTEFAKPKSAPLPKSNNGKHK